MKIFPPQGNFSTHIGWVECKGRITAKNSTLELKTGPVEVEIKTENDQNRQKRSKIKKNWLITQINPIFFTGSYSGKF